MFSKTARKPVRSSALVNLVASASIAIAAPVGSVPITNPITPAADTTKVLVSSPYCGTPSSPVTLTDITHGSPGSLFSSIPTTSFNSGCAEIPIAISPGLVGFFPGSVYVAYPDSNGTNTVIASIPPAGGAPTPIGTIPGAFDHVGLVFDAAATYGGGLLVMTETGNIYSIKGGTISSPHTITGISGLHLESPAIAPVGFGPLGGLLWAVNEKELGGSDDALYAIDASFHATKVVDVSAGSFPDRAESLAFVSANACSAPTPGGASTLLDALYQSNLVVFYQATGPAAYFNNEFGQSIFKLTANGTKYSVTTFDNVLGQQEHLAAPVCLPNFPDGRWTGGGSVFTNDGTRVTHGLELHCDVNRLPNNLEINWGGGNNFHLDALTTAACFFDPSVGSPKPPSADFNTIIATGTGSCNNTPGATISFTLTDAGEPGTKDTATFVIGGGGCPALSVSGNLDKGNQQAHNH
jgi:hypothetical protein